MFPVSAVAAHFVQIYCFDTLNAELNPICHLLALLRAHLILHLSRIRFKGESTLLIDRPWDILNIMKDLKFR